MDELDDALDALEGMVTQYLDSDLDGTYDHMSMAVGEIACEVLAELRPDKWELTPTGLIAHDDGWVPEAELDVIDDD